MDDLLKLSKSLPFTVKVRKPANRSNSLYRPSSLLLLHASPEMKAYRKNIMKILKENGYSISFLETKLFMPHITVRLGVPYSKSTKTMIQQSFEVGKDISLSKWVIFRIIKKDGKRLVKEISLTD
jgi:hypothetical protein